MCACAIVVAIVVDVIVGTVFRVTKSNQLLVMYHLFLLLLLLDRISDIH